MPSFGFPTRRSALALLIAVTSTVASAQVANYPSKPVTVIVPFAAGGSVDSAARVVLQSLSERTKQSFVVENVAGKLPHCDTWIAAGDTPPPAGEVAMFNWQLGLTKAPEKVICPPAALASLHKAPEIPPHVSRVKSLETFFITVSR